MPPEVQEITRLDDPRVEAFRDVRDRDLRGRGDLFMAESELVVRRMLRHPHRVHSLLLSQIRFNAMREEIEASTLKAPVYVAPIELMCDIAGFHIHRGALAAGNRPASHELQLDSALGFLQHAPTATVIVAEGLTNVDNMGALFRNAAAFGVDGILLDSSCCDPLYRKAIRVSMGHVLSVPYAITAEWPSALTTLKQWGMRVVAAESNVGSLPVWRLPKADKMAMVFGSEGHGLTDAVLELCDDVCEIPMGRDVPSLNVAVASAVFLYEHRRAH